MRNEEPFLAERMGFIIRDEKFTFLKGYGDNKNLILVVSQHMRTGETKAEHYTYDRMEHHFGYAARQIIGYVNRMIPTYKPR